MTKAREFISPSDLTFAWDKCHRCLWLNYNHGVKAPANFPLVAELSALQEGHFKGASSSDLHPDLPAGRVISSGGWVKSIPIPFNGEPSPFAIRGKYDLLMEFADGTYGIIDCKFQGKDSDKSGFYAPQLEAYAFALENSVVDPRKDISLMGLLVWSPRRTTGSPINGFGLELSNSWFPIQRDPAKLQLRLTEFIKVISGPSPAPDSGCDICRFITDRREIFGNE